MGAFAGGLAIAGVVARALDRDPQEHTALDLVALGAATFKASRTLSHDEVTSFLREPFVEGHAHEGGEEPVATGDLQQAIGELVTCSRCIGAWVAAGLATTQILAPRFGRLLTWSLPPPASTTSCRPASLRSPAERLICAPLGRTEPVALTMEDIGVAVTNSIGA